MPPNNASLPPAAAPAPVPVPPVGGHPASQPTAHHKGSSKLPWVLMAVFVLLFLGAVGFGIWAYGSQQDYKNNADQKIADAVVIAKKETATQKDNEFVEKYKNPYDLYEGPDTYGSVRIQYPRTWSAYINEKGGSTPLEGYWHPGFVPGVDSGTAFALHVEVVNQSFEQQVKSFDSKVKSGKVKVAPYKAKQVPDVTGSRVEGEINTGQKNYMVLFPIRDKTLKVSTQSDRFLGDFNNIILPNLKFTP